VDHDPRVVRGENARRSRLMPPACEPSGQLPIDSAGQEHRPVWTEGGSPRPDRVESSAEHLIACRPSTLRKRRTLAPDPTAANREDFHG